jgi:hypothetical protein
MVDFESLRRAANANLIRLSTGVVRRERLGKRLGDRSLREYRIDHRRDLQEERDRLVKESTEWREERAALEHDFSDVYRKFNNGEDLDHFERGTLEEVDYRVDELDELIVEAEARISVIEWELKGD